MLRFAFFVLVCYLGFLLLLLVRAGASKPQFGRFYFYEIQIWIQNFASLIFFFVTKKITKPFNIF